MAQVSPGAPSPASIPGAPIIQAGSKTSSKNWTAIPLIRKARPALHLRVQAHARAHVSAAQLDVAPRNSVGSFAAATHPTMPAFAPELP